MQRGHEAAQRVLCHGLGFAEAPRWHDDHLWVSDVACHVVLRISEDGTVEEACALDDQPSGLGWLPDGRMLVVSMHRRVVLRQDPDGLSVHADLSALVDADLNDMVVDEAGRAYVTNFGDDGTVAARRPTSIIIVQPDGMMEFQPGELFRPNGCGITPDGGTFIVAETRRHCLTAFDRAPDGRLSGPRTMATLPSGTWADGLCLDEAGAVWVADPKGRHVYRVNAKGSIVSVIDTAPFQAIACVLGGPDRRRLYVTVAHIRPFPEMAADRTSEIHEYDVDVPGAGIP